MCNIHQPLGQVPARPDTDRESASPRVESSRPRGFFPSVESLQRRGREFAPVPGSKGQTSRQQQQARFAQTCHPVRPSVPPSGSLALLGDSAPRLPNQGNVYLVCAHDWMGWIAKQANVTQSPGGGGGVGGTWLARFDLTATLSDGVQGLDVFFTLKKITCNEIGAAVEIFWFPSPGFASLERPVCCVVFSRTVCASSSIQNPTTSETRFIATPPPPSNLLDAYRCSILGRNSSHPKICHRNSDLISPGRSLACSSASHLIIITPPHLRIAILFLSFPLPEFAESPSCAMHDAR